MPSSSWVSDTPWMIAFLCLRPTQYLSCILQDNHKLNLILIRESSYPMFSTKPAVVLRRTRVKGPSMYRCCPLNWLVLSGLTTCLSNFSVKSPFPWIPKASRNTPDSHLPHPLGPSCGFLFFTFSSSFFSSFNPFSHHLAFQMASCAPRWPFPLICRFPLLYTPQLGASLAPFQVAADLGLWSRRFSSYPSYPS